MKQKNLFLLTTAFVAQTLLVSFNTLAQEVAKESLKKNSAISSDSTSTSKFIPPAPALKAGTGLIELYVGGKIFSLSSGETRKERKAREKHAEANDKIESIKAPVEAAKRSLRNAQALVTETQRQEAIQAAEGTVDRRARLVGEMNETVRSTSWQKTVSGGLQGLNTIRVLHNTDKAEAAGQPTSPFGTILKTGFQNALIETAVSGGHDDAVRRLDYAQSELQEAEAQLEKARTLKTATPQEKEAAIAEATRRHTEAVAIIQEPLTAAEKAEAKAWKAYQKSGPGIIHGTFRLTGKLTAAVVWVDAMWKAVQFKVLGMDEVEYFPLLRRVSSESEKIISDNRPFIDANLPKAIELGKKAKETAMELKNQAVKRMHASDSTAKADSTTGAK